MASENDSPLYRDPRASVEARVSDLLGRMTVEEKIAQLSAIWVYEVLDDGVLVEKEATARMGLGIGQITRIGGASHLGPLDSAKMANQIQSFLVENTRLGIPALVHEEACSGYMAKDATCFPQAIGIASSFDVELVEAMAEVVRDQMRAVGAHQALAPLLDVTRDPRWGRTEETFGEDPYLVAQMGMHYVRGLQGGANHQMVMATGKHFVGYGEAEGGMNWAPAHIPARELREVFLFPFEAAVKAAGLASIMPGYHELDGVACHANRWLLTDLLRESWGFQGLVVSDYFAIASLATYHKMFADAESAAVWALKAGVDVELPSRDYYSRPLQTALDHAPEAEAWLDLAVKRVLRWKFQLGLFESCLVDVQAAPKVFDIPSQRKLARRAARESMVLLKNDFQTLPLSPEIRSIAIIGPNADTVRNLVGDYAYPCHVETLIDQRDSGNIFNTPLPRNLRLADQVVPMITLYQALKERAGSELRVSYAKGSDIQTEDRSGFAEAVELAKTSDVAILAVGDRAGLVEGCTTGESRDRVELTLPGVQADLIRAVLATGTPVVLVLINGRPIALEPDILGGAAAILEAWFPGEEGAPAVADVLFGDYNPSGRLPISFPRAVGQIPVYYYHKPSGGRSHWHGKYVEMGTDPLFAFGYGLSYTAFEYSNLKLDRNPLALGQPLKGSFEVTNIGDISGDEVVQVYLSRPYSRITRPVKQLLGFCRVELAPQQVKRVRFELAADLLGYYDESMHFVLEPGLLDITIGASSADIRLSERVDLTGEAKVLERKTFAASMVVESPSHPR
ncbi:MAG: glycoside hydrolase family 3 C-terminal domain-containing protein [Firmicutes bacterium]|nr:glycoside hydrolase family 3 C-terminal domain-containing protein [Bacillota bacterium]MCL5064015.1 glycoside hydrolase family 3 C-terminal domain-containing protein [Bacillota bacterium]